MSKANSDTRFSAPDKRGKHNKSPGYQPGNHWVVCDMCGFDIRAFDIKETWDNRMVCPRDWEPRQPQDFVRARRDNIRAQDPIRPDPTPIELNPCNGPTAIAGLAIAGCAVAGNSNKGGTILPIPDGTFNTNTL